MKHLWTISASEPTLKKNNWSAPAGANVGLTQYGLFCLVTDGRSTVAGLDHIQARELCSKFGGPIISTSLNRSGQAPLISYEKAAAEFSDDRLYFTRANIRI